ncbi:MAG: gamma-glutamyltransferase [Pseudomonadota bacterium]
MLDFARLVRRLRYCAGLAAIALCPTAAPAEERCETDGKGAMVVTANPLATDAALTALRRGGNAIDAFVASQLVLGLVEPQATGLGGGGFLVYYDAKRRQLQTYDAREKAPAGATERLFLKPDGTELGFSEAVLSGRSVGVPGVPMLLAVAHRAHGKQRWASLFESALQLAENGFVISPRLSAQIAANATNLARDPAAAAYFLNPDGSAKAAGTLLENPAYAETLGGLRRDGASGFYSGKIAADIARAVQQDPAAPGSLTPADLASYRVVVRAPVCGAYRVFEICGMGPPSSGGVMVAQLLGLLEPYDMAAAGPGTLRSVHLFTQANRLAFADRALYLADPDFVDVPVAGLLDPAYLASRSSLILEDRDLGTATPGVPPGAARRDAADASFPRFGGTSHSTIRDACGNMVSTTTTVESPFGNNRMVDGFLLNNELTDFAFTPTINGSPVANRVEPNKRPRSSMAPTIVFDPDGEVAYTAGTPGGASIIAVTAQTLIEMIDWKLTPQQAAAFPHFLNNNGNTLLETTLPSVNGPLDLNMLAPALTAMGHTVTSGAVVSGTGIIQVSPAGLIGGADPRREGTVGGFRR